MSDLDRDWLAFCLMLLQVFAEPIIQSVGSLDANSSFPHKAVQLRQNDYGNMGTVGVVGDGVPCQNRKVCLVVNQPEAGAGIEYVLLHDCLPIRVQRSARPPHSSAGNGFVNAFESRVFVDPIKSGCRARRDRPF